jgi:hypothetical protein
MKPRNHVMVWEFLFDFLLGGGLIACVLAIGKYFGPLIAGIIAALPVRLGTTLFLAGMGNDVVFATEMIKGVLPGSLGALGFMIILSNTTLKFGLWKSFILACLTCLMIVYGGYYAWTLL